MRKVYPSPCHDSPPLTMEKLILNSNIYHVFMHKASLSVISIMCCAASDL